MKIKQPCYAVESQLEKLFSELTDGKLADDFINGLETFDKSPSFDDMVKIMNSNRF